MSDEAAEVGLVCPKCGCRHWHTRRTMHTTGGKVRRYKTCRHCGRRIVTYEVTSAQVKKK